MESRKIKMKEKKNKKVIDKSKISDDFEKGINNETKDLNTNNSGNLKKIILKVAPLETKRRFFLKLARNALKNPKVYLKSLNIQNIKKVKEIMKSKGIKNLEERLDSFDEKGKDIEAMKLEIFQERKIFEKIIFEKFEEIKVSIIIPVYNQWEDTYNCLESIKKKYRRY